MEATAVPNVAIVLDEVQDKSCSEVMLFNYWSYNGVEVSDISVEDYITATASTRLIYMPHTAARYQAWRFRKAQCPIAESLTNSLMMHGRNNGKKLMVVPPPPAAISPPCSPDISGDEEALLDNEEEDGFLKASSPSPMSRHEALECIQIGPDFCENISNDAVKAIAICGPRLRKLGNLFVGEEYKGAIAETSGIKALVDLIPGWSRFPGGEGRYLRVLGCNQSQGVVFVQILMRFGVGKYDWTERSCAFDPGGILHRASLSMLFVAPWFPP